MKGSVNFTPSVYEHAAALIGRTPLQVSQSSDLLFRAHAEAFRLYQHSPVVAGIDIYNLEAEAYGAVISTPGDNGIPAISKHPLCCTKEIRSLDPLDPATGGRIPMVVEAGIRLAKTFPHADVRIPVSGPFSLAANLIGFDNLLQEILLEPDSVLEALIHLVQGQISFGRKVIESGLGIAFFESGATPPLISPELFSRIELPALKSMVTMVSEIAGHPVPCIIGGNTAPVIHSIMETGTGYVICPSETDQDLFMQEMEAWPDTMVRINIKPDGFSSGDIEFIYNELERVLALASRREKVCLGTGVLPFETNPELVLKAKEYVDKY